jgi:hypothetical protein
VKKQKKGVLFEKEKKRRRRKRVRKQTKINSKRLNEK